MNIKSIFTFRTIIAGCFFLLFSITQVNAQEKGIYEIPNSTSNTDRSQFYDLAFNLHPTIYLKNNVIKKIYGEGLIKKITVDGINSFGILKNEDSNYEEVELISIKLSSISDLNTQLDLSKTSVFVNLKYIYINSSFKLEIGDVVNFIKAHPNVRVLYKSANPS